MHLVLSIGYLTLQLLERTTESSGYWLVLYRRGSNFAPVWHALCIVTYCIVQIRGSFWLGCSVIFYIFAACFSYLLWLLETMATS